MSVNRYLPHIMVLPEDDANRQLANGFQMDSQLDTRRMQVLPEAGGWTAVLDRFRNDHIAAMQSYPKRLMVLLIDFDERQDRISEVKAVIPLNLKDRVFVLGSWSEPERLRQQLGGFEEVGGLLAKDCRENADATWNHELLRHNAEELQRLREQARAILFQP